MTTSTTPATAVATATPSWISLLINLGASLGASFVKNTQVGQLIELAATTTTSIISQVQAAKTTAATTGTSTTSLLVVPIFVSVLQAALSVALAEGKISATDAGELSKALLALGTEDAIAQKIVDYTTIGAISTLA